MKEYAIYPFAKMGISQRHDQGNHIAHWKPFKDYADKPWDECCGDSGQDYFCPQNDFVIEEVLGLRHEITNTLRLRSVNKLYTPFKDEPDYLYITLTHMNYDDLVKFKVGQVIHKGEKIIREGKDAPATGNHFHITANFGKYYGYKQNSNGVICMVYEKSLIPTEAFYLDKSFTKIISSNGYTFKDKPKEEVTSFFGKKGYFSLGDTHENIGKIADFMYRVFPAYTNKKALGNYYGPYIKASIAEFQRRTGLEADGCVGPITLAELQKYGFRY